MRRRSFLAGVTTATVAGLAGCSLLGSGDDDPSSTGGGPIARWTVPRTADSAGTDPYHVRSIAPRTIADMDDSLFDDDLDRPDADQELERWWSSLDPSNVERLLAVDRGTTDQPASYEVFEGSIDRADLRESLELRNVEDEGTYGGYERYSHESGGGRTYVWGLGEERVLLCVYPTGEGSVSALDSVVDVGAGETETQVQRAEGFATLLDRLEPEFETDVRWYPPSGRAAAPAEGVVADGRTIGQEGETFRTQIVWVCDSTDLATESVAADVRDEFLDDDDVDEPSVSVDGRVVELTATGEYDEFE